MSSTRRKLPPPPLVIRPILVRVPLKSPSRPRMLNLARFLNSKRLLTDGGVKNLELEFLGRNETCSLSTQDVRGWAQSLVLDLWSAESSDWEAIAQAYFGRYDKQKPRRPNHLQRLYLEWSPDYSWPGLLRATANHPNLWKRFEFAVEKLHDDHPDKEFLNLALASRLSLAPLDRAFREEVFPIRKMLSLLGCLPHQDWSERLKRYEQIASRIQQPKLAYHFVSQLGCPMSKARALKGSVVLTRIGELARDERRFHDVNYLCGYRTFVSTKEEVCELFRTVQEDDPIRRVRFGPRPGKVWLDCLRAELEELIALRLETSSQLDI